MEFKKYGDIENSYRQKFIDNFAKYNDLSKIKFVALEKLDGANFQIKIGPNGEMAYGTRNRFLNIDDNFFEWQKAVGKLNLQPVIDYTIKNKKEITLFGELHGKGIQKGIIYQDEKLIRFFDIDIDGKTTCFNEFKNFMEMFNLEMVPIIATDLILEQALDIDVETLKSRIDLNQPDINIAEGIVIRPMYKEIYYGDNRFILKKKSINHTEKQNKNKKIKSIDPIVKEWKKKLSQYITKSRMQNVFSKEGIIESPKQISKYIKLFIQDAVKDFLKDYPEFEKVNLNKKQKKNIMNFSKEIVSFLNKEL